MSEWIENLAVRLPVQGNTVVSISRTDEGYRWNTSRIGGPYITPHNQKLYPEYNGEGRTIPPHLIQLMERYSGQNKDRMDDSPLVTDAGERYLLYEKLGFVDSATPEMVANSIGGCFRCRYFQKGHCMSPESTWNDRVCTRSIGILPAWDRKEDAIEYLSKIVKILEEEV